jgi:hypothetical protein
MSVKIDTAQLRAERAIAHRADPLTTITTKDRLGNTLVDVMNRDGFCTGVRSAGTITASLIVPKGAASASYQEVLALPHRDPETGLWWVGEDRLVQRMVTTPDGPLKVARVVKASTAEKLDRRASAASKVKRAPRGSTTQGDRAASSKSGQGKRARVAGVARPTEKQVTAYIRNKYGFTGSLTPKIRKAAVVAIMADRSARDFF